MKFCAICGKKLEDGCLFCIYCGAKQPPKEGEVVNATVVAVPPQPVTPVPPPVTVQSQYQPVVPKEPIPSAKEFNGPQPSVKDKVFGWVGFGLGLNAFLTSITALLIGFLAHEVDYDVQAQMILYSVLTAVFNIPVTVCGFVFSSKSQATMAIRGNRFSILSVGFGVFAFLVALSAI